MSAYICNAGCKQVSRMMMIICKNILEPSHFPSTSPIKLSTSAFNKYYLALRALSDEIIASRCGAIERIERRGRNRDNFVRGAIFPRPDIKIQHRFCKIRACCRRES